MAAKTEMLFSLNSLPTDRSILHELRRRVNAKLGEASLDLSNELLENLEVARNLRDRLCNSKGYGVSEEDFDLGGDEPDYDPAEIKESSKISSVVACSSIIHNIVKMQEIVHSQQANAVLQDAIIEVLAVYDDEVKEKVVELFKEKVKELERQARTK